MSNYKRLNTNTLQLGQDQGTCSIIPQNSNRIKCEMDLVKSTGANLIDYNESTNTIDFNNVNISNFSGGGGGGGGDVFLANTQTFTGVNTFSANTVLSTVDTGNISTTGTVTASGTVTGGTIVTSGNCTIGGSTTVQGIQTNNIQTTGTIACSSNIQGASLSAAAGDITATSGNINGLSLQSSGGVINFQGGNARIEDDSNRDMRIQANANTNTIKFRLGGTAADNLVLSYDSVTNKSVLQLYDFSATPPQLYPIGQNPDDFTTLVTALQAASLTYNNATTQQFDGSLISNGTVLFNGVAVQIGAGSGTTTIQLMNDAADTTNVVAGTMQFDTTASLAKTGTTSGATDIFTSVDTVLNRSAPSWLPTKQNIVAAGTGTGTDIELIAGTNTITVSVASSIIFTQFGTDGSGTAIYRVTGRGRLRFTNQTTTANINLFTLPAGLRPFVEQNFISQGHSGISQARLDISTAGLVTLIGTATTLNSQFVNLGSIDFWAGI